MGNRIVIIGAGPAGVTVAETVRAHDKHAELIVISAEPHPPYSPPAMVDHFIHSSGAHLWRGQDWPERTRVEYLPGTTVTAIHTHSHHLITQDDQTLAYDHLVIATGSRLHAPISGADLPGVYNFKSLSAAEDLVKRVKRGEARSAIIVGAGFIGMEIALLLQELGVDVIQVEMLDQVMPAMLDANTATYALRMMRRRGVDVRLNTKATAFLGEDRAIGVELDSGDVLDADIYIAATGVRPNLELLDGSDISHQWGITVDDHLRTNQPNVFAAGDVIEVPDRLTGELYVHAIFPNAVNQGRVVGFNLLGYDLTYEGADRMNSLKHLGLPIIAVGNKNGDEILQTKRNGKLRTLYLEGGRLVGFQLVGDISTAGILRTIMYQRQDINQIKHKLLDPTFGQGIMTWRAINPI